jgi:oligopeptide/dipeptide ABC transporter ATP-binding protein
MESNETKGFNGDCLEVRNLQTSFFTRKGVVRAVDDISFSVSTGEVLGIVGESGCGKTMTALSIMRHVPFPGRVVGGEVWFKGQNLLALKASEMQSIRGRRISIILQDPFAALNPVFTIGNQLSEVLPTDMPRKTVKDRVVDMLRRVHITRPESRYSSFPHELSGGMNQRSVIGMGLLPNPDLLIADEPTTSLDVTIQAQVLLLLTELQRQSGMAMIYITHDFGVVATICTTVAVMYCGKIVEKAPVDSLFKTPTHPYTKGLLHSLPRMDGSRALLPTIPGQPGIAYESLRGCPFAERCPQVRSLCSKEFPADIEIGREHWVACWATRG